MQRGKRLAMFPCTIFLKRKKKWSLYLRQEAAFNFVWRSLSCFVILEMIHKQNRKQQATEWKQAIDLKTKSSQTHNCYTKKAEGRRGGDTTTPKNREKLKMQLGCLWGGFPSGNEGITSLRVLLHPLKWMDTEQLQTCVAAILWCPFWGTHWRRWAKPSSLHTLCQKTICTWTNGLLHGVALLPPLSHIMLGSLSIFSPRTFLPRCLHQGGLTVGAILGPRTSDPLPQKTGDNPDWIIYTIEMDHYCVKVSY